LKLLWVLEEDNHRDINHFKLNSDDADADALVETLLHQGLASVAGTDIALTGKDRKRHAVLFGDSGLLERLFTDVFEMPDDTVVSDACQDGTYLERELTESVCTFLVILQPALMTSLSRRASAAENSRLRSHL